MSAGVSCELFSLLKKNYIYYKYSSGRSKFSSVIVSFLKRIWDVLSVPRDSVIFLEYELFPWFPALFERWLVLKGCSIIVDYDDALFHQYDQNKRKFVRFLFGNKIKSVMCLASVVTVGNSYLRDFAISAGAKRIEVIPTVVDIYKYSVRRQSFDVYSDTTPFTIGWIGSPSTQHYLLAIVPALVQVCSKGNMRLRLIGANPFDLPGIPAEFIVWSEDTEVSQIMSFDVGIMPLPDEPWTRGKCGLKLIQYMACGVPVIASPVGVNLEIVTEGANGYLARTIEDWIQAFDHLRTHRIIGQRMGVAGRRLVEDRYCMQVTAPKLIALIQSLNSDGVA
jgi:glycosyltransferase involved in cell wall biosynthesis